MANLYDQQPGVGSALFWHGAVPLGTIYAHSQMSKWMLGGAAERYKRRFGGQSGVRRQARQMSRSAWTAFFDAEKGWDVLGRFDAARTAAGLRQMKATKAVGMRSVLKGALGKAGIGRTMAALAQPAIGVGAAYYTWAWLLPAAADFGVNKFKEFQREGEKWRRGTPETSVGFRDMATKERAFTMRQASAMAIHTSQMGVRSSLGSEATFLHS